ncbi:hypothetical protein FRC00_005332, partial [Tulasnella sp. 408]
GQWIRIYWPLYYLVLAFISIPYLLSALVAGIILRAKRTARTAKKYGAKYLENRSRVPRLLIKICKSFLEYAFEEVGLTVSPWSGESPAYLHAVAAKRVLCTSEDFNALIFTAINLQAMTERESVQCLLDEDIVHKRLDDLGQSRDAALASVFSRAFPHLLLSSGSTALFVEQDARPLYSEGTLYPKKHEHAIYDHPLKSKVDTVWLTLFRQESHHTDQSNSKGPLLCFDFMRSLLTEDYDDRHFWIWVDNFVENQPASKLASLAVIEFVARAISTVHAWSDSAHRPAIELRRSGLIAVWEQRPGEAYERQEDLQTRYLTVQQQRVETFKGLIDVNWDVPLGFPHSETTFEQVYPRLKRAFDAIETAIKKVPTVPNIDVNPADPPPLPTDGADLDRMRSNGIAEVVTAKSGASAPGTPVPDPPKDKGTSGELTDAGKDSRSQVGGTSHPRERVADEVSEPTVDEKE